MATFGTSCLGAKEAGGILVFIRRMLCGNLLSSGKNVPLKKTAAWPVILVLRTSATDVLI
jgi:hypothetical protein